MSNIFYNRNKFIEDVQKEVDQAKGKNRYYSILHVVTISLNIILGGLTTFLIAFDFKDKPGIVATLAFIITILGTFEKTFGFGKKKAGYREAKTRFENLIIDVYKLTNDKDSNDTIPNEYLDKLQEIRNLKVELTNNI